MEYTEQFIATRWSLLSRMRNLDDQVSWQDFFDTYWKLIYGVALKAGLDDAAAQDVVQETVLTVVRKLSEFKTDPSAGSFKGWLMHIVRWRVADQFRCRQRLDRWLVPVADGSDATPALEQIPDSCGLDMERIWDEEWEKNLVDVALERVKTRVSAGLYQMFDLYVIKRWPVREVAKALHVSVGHVYVAKHRVSGLVKQEIRELRKMNV